MQFGKAISPVSVRQELESERAKLALFSQQQRYSLRRVESLVHWSELVDERAC